MIVRRKEEAQSRNWKISCKKHEADPGDLLKAYPKGKYDLKVISPTGEVIIQPNGIDLWAQNRFIIVQE